VLKKYKNLYEWTVDPKPGNTLLTGGPMVKNNEITDVQENPMSLESSKVNGQLPVEAEGIKKAFKATGFTRDDPAMNTIVPIFNALVKRGCSDEDARQKVDQLLSTMCELDPQDGHEGKLIGMMLVAYDRAMECFKRAEVNASNANVYLGLQNQGIKLMRIYAQLLEALDKHRNKGRQKMTVEHIHVNKGGQAIVGNLSHEGGGVSNGKRE
jgi:hypothetical protein